MFRSRNKKIVIPKKDYKPTKNVNPNSFFSHSKDSIILLRNEVFKQVKNLDKQGNDAYVLMNEKRFKHLLLSKEYVDPRYIALQIYLLQDDVNTFAYEEIHQILTTFIGFIEKTLHRGRSISFDGVFYLTGAPQKPVITKNRVPRVAVSRTRPKGIVFALKDIEINLAGTREFALHELIIAHFNKVFFNLLKTKGQVLLGNILILQLGTDYAAVVSERFLIGIDNKEISTLSQANVSSQAPMPVPPKPPAQVPKPPPAKRNIISDIFYKTEQIFLHRRNRAFKANSRAKQARIRPESIWKPKRLKFKSTLKMIFNKQNSKIIDTRALKDEITDANKRIGRFKSKRQAPGKSNDN